MNPLFPPRSRSEPVWRAGESEKVENILGHIAAPVSRPDYNLSPSSHLFSHQRAGLSNVCMGL